MWKEREHKKYKPKLLNKTQTDLHHILPLVAWQKVDVDSLIFVPSFETEDLKYFEHEVNKHRALNMFAHVHLFICSE